VTKRGKADGCTPEQLCARCSMIRVIAHRFVIFRQTFGREPLPSEPLFFVANAKRPVVAQQEEVNAQLAEAAEKTGVSLVKIWNLLGIGEPIEVEAPQLRAVK
jgi:hypothetical protein